MIIVCTAPASGRCPWQRTAHETGRFADVDLATFFAGRSKWVTAAIALVFLVTVGLTDFVTGREVSLSVFYVGGRPQSPP